MKRRIVCILMLVMALATSSVPAVAATRSEKIAAKQATIRTRSSEKPKVWAYDETYNDWVPVIRKTITKCVPKPIIKEFIKQGYSVVISTETCDRYNIAGLTNGTGTDKNGWYDWAEEGQKYMELTPTHGIHSAQMTVLHEFGHVLDMMTEATADEEILADIESELPFYNQVMVNNGYMIPEMKNGHELFAQVFASVVSGDTGYVNNAKEVMNACPVTTAYIQGILSKW